jgi:hypothetical protein
LREVEVSDKERAFPSVAIDDRCGGMSMWDWYAGQALAGLCAKDHRPVEDLAMLAARRADAMMVQRAARAERAKRAARAERAEP